MMREAGAPVRLVADGAPSRQPDRSPFAHASEAELARILDFYAVRWEYEPHVFPILWNLDGGVVESFSPDFYLPDFDSYVELTTLRQPLVRKKNRKLRRLRELYPDVRIKLFYARDFRALMLKYGKFGLVDALSGTLGQVIPMAAVVAPVDAGAADPDGASALVERDGTVSDTEPGDARPARLRRRAKSASTTAGSGSDARGGGRD
jgi:hypoxanthine phosphoribosyltransferase